MEIANNDIIPFVKMHGAGNDYIYINALETCPENLSELAKEISDRHFGVGSDGLIVILPSEEADFRMLMYNSDGSRAEMCGNASRCIAKFIYHYGLSDKKIIRLSTDAGIRTLYLSLNEKGEVENITVDMGQPILKPSEIPVIADEMDSEGIPLVKLTSSEGEEFKAIAVSMGNPHGVIYLDDNQQISDHLVLKNGKEFEYAKSFPKKANIEFVKVESTEKITMRVWERGAGETLACGTGACAAVVAGILSGRLNRKVEVELPGGNLLIEWRESDSRVMMSGDAEIVAEGNYYRKNR